MYIYYSEKTNHDGHDDVAITEADSLDEAIDNFKLYTLRMEVIE